MDWLGPVLYEYYGSTESTIAFAVKPHEWLAHPGTVGRPVPTMEARILGENGEEGAAGDPGDGLREVVPEHLRIPEGPGEDGAPRSGANGTRPATSAISTPTATSSCSTGGPT